MSNVSTKLFATLLSLPRTDLIENFIALESLGGGKEKLE